LRKAVNYAINRQELWKYAAKGNAYNLGGYIPPGASGFIQNLQRYSYDTDKARALLTEAGFRDGFGVKIIAPEALKLEAQILSKMLERIGLNVRYEVFNFIEFAGKTYMPALDKPPEEQDWDIALYILYDWYAHTGAIFLTIGFVEEMEMRWIAWDPVFEKMAKLMGKTVDVKAQQEKVRQMVQYVYDRAYNLFIYSPLSLYAVNKEVHFVPQKFQFLRLKETSVTDNHWSLRGKNE
jgi:ABC-type transport system substrate-binding protein